MRVAIVTGRPTETDQALAARSWAGEAARILTPRDALLFLRAGDVALARLDVSETLDGLDEGSWELERSAEAGILVMNRPHALLACHDRLVTARKLRLAGLPHPQTVGVEAGRRPPDLDFPLVLRPRFGDDGEVGLCRDAAELERRLDELAFRPWFRAHGGVAQEVISPAATPIRLVVAGGRIVGDPDEASSALARGLAVRAAAAVGADLAGVELLPTGTASFCVLSVDAGAVLRTDELQPVADALVDLALGAAATAAAS